MITITTNPPPQHGGFGVPGFMHVTPDRPKNGDAIHSARALAGLIAPHPANYSRPACLFFCVWICFCSRSGFILCEFGYLFSVSPAYQHVYLPKHRLSALWIHINKLLLLSRQLHSRLGVHWNSPLGLPGAVITLGQATASVGLADRQTVGLPLASRSQPL